MHTPPIRSIIWLPAVLAIASVSAVPSSTNFNDPTNRRHGLPSHPHVVSTVDTPQSPWTRASNRLAGWAWNYWQGRDVLEIASPNGQGTPPSRLLAQYGDQIVLRFVVSTQEEADTLAEAIDLLFLDVWNSGPDGVDIRLAKDVLPSLLGLLPQSMQHAHKPLMQGHELAQTILDTHPSTTASISHHGSLQRTLLPANPSETNVFFADYQSLGSMTHWMNLLQSLFRTHVQLVTVGTSYQGRNITALRVGLHDTQDLNPAPRKTIIVSGGAHAREWVSITTVNYIAYSFIIGFGKDRQITKLLSNTDFLFIPTLNPDGYIHSYEVDRLWRKNRQPTSLPFCPGIDLDRSWPFEWDGARTIDNPCSESFAGTKPFEAVEAASFGAWAKNASDSGVYDFIGFLDLHSYSQEILYPYSYSCSNEPPTVEDLEEMGYGLQRAIGSRTLTHYKVMQACEGNVAADGKVLPRIASGGGSILDWMYAELGVKKAFQIKLRDNGVYGFLLPKEYIVPTGREILEAVQYFAKALGSGATTVEDSLKTGSDETIFDDL